MQEISTKKIWALAAATLLLVGFSSSADDRDATAQAQAAAKKWLALVDGAVYGQSWEDASSLFKGAVTKADWELRQIEAGSGPGAP